MPGTRAATKAESRERNSGFQQTHRQLIEAAIRLISEKGVDALSLAELARELKLNRTTIYYHFRNREQLIAEVKHRAAQELSTGLDLNLSREERIDYITRFVLENNELIRLWISDLLSGTDIRSAYPAWDKLVAGFRESFAAEGSPVDVEVYCLNLLVSAFVAPGIFRASVAPEESIDSIVERYRKEYQRALTR